MSLITLWRTFKFAFQNFWRNLWLSVVTVLILALVVFLTTVIAGTKVIADQAVASVRRQVDVSVTFKPDVPVEKIIATQNKLENLPDVKKVTYVSADEALTKFREKNKDKQSVLQAIEALGTNPLNPALIIEAEDLDAFPAILSTFDDPDTAPLVADRKQDFEASTLVINRLRSLTGNISTVGLALAGVFALIAVLMVFNTIRITIYTYREEIGIMKLVGASNGFIRAPFIIESVLYAILACIVTMAVLLPILNAMAPLFDRFFEGYDIDFIGYFNVHFLRIFGLQILAVSLLSFISSGIAVSRYLRV